MAGEERSQSHFIQLVGAATLLLGLIGSVGAVAVYGANLKNDFEAAKVRVVQLETQLDELRKRMSTAGIGGVGERGADGPAGPRGPKGDAGPPGPHGEAGTIDEAKLDQKISAAVEARIKNTKVSPSNVLAGVQIAPSVFDTGKCVPISEYNSTKAYAAKIGLELCGNEGQVLFRVKNVGATFVYFDIPGSGSSRCNFGDKCSLDFDKERVFFIERIEGQNGKNVAQIRFGPRD